MNTKRILCGILAAAMMLIIAGCGESDSTTTTGSTKKPSVTTSGSVTEDTNEPTVTTGDSEANGSTPDSGEDAGYKLPAGAASEYELYKTVVDFLNNGFHYDDLKDVYDRNLMIVFYSKWEETPEKIFTLGMKYEEACDLIVRLINKTKEMDPPYDETGHIEEDLIDYDAFRSEFPESLQSQIDENHYDYEHFIEDIYYYAEGLDGIDGENPFRSDQTEWELKGEGELDIEVYHSNDWDDDLYTNFPRVYEVSLGKYITYEGYSMWFYYTKIEGRYYFLGLSYSISGIGG